MKKLDLGCGEQKKEGYVTIDIRPEVNPDIVHNLNIVPYPFADNTFDIIEADHVLEHLDKPFLIMKELHRVLKPDGKLIIRVPHFSRGFTHAEHCHGFDITFPSYFTKGFIESGIMKVEFKLEETRLKWLAFFHLLPHFGYKKTSINFLKAIDALVSFLANLSPNFCSRIWCFWVGGFEEIEFRFICKK